MKSMLIQAVALSALAAIASAQVPAGGEFRVNTSTTYAQYPAVPAMEPDGDFVVVWTSMSQDGDNNGVFGQRFAASGARRGAEFQINTYTTGSQYRAAVAVGSKGDFVVVWQSPGDGSGYSGIQGRRYDAMGSAVGGEFLVNAVTLGYQEWPRVGRASDGRFIVTWMSQGVDGDVQGIAARRFDAAGDPIGGEFVVNAYTPGYQGVPGLAVAADGSFVVVWEDHNSFSRDGSGFSLFGQRYDAAGSRTGSEFAVNSYTTGNQVHPSVAISPEGGFVVAWTGQFGVGNSAAMFARRFDAAGNALGGDFVVNTSTTGVYVSMPGVIAMDALGSFAVTWDSLDGSGSGVFVQRFSASGARRGAEFRVNSYTFLNQRRPAIASDAVGNFVVGWDSFTQDGSSYGVHAQRFGGLVPAALAVDTPGNQVLEPGEMPASFGQRGGTRTAPHRRSRR